MMTSKEVHFLIEGEPFGKQRPKFNGTGKFVRVYTPKQTTDYEKKVAKAYREVAGDFSFEDKPIAITIYAFHQVPKSYTKKVQEQIKSQEILATRKADIDNICKIILDGLNKVAFHDDSQVVKATISKHYVFDHPCVYVRIKEATKEDMEDGEKPMV